MNTYFDLHTHKTWNCPKKPLILDFPASPQLPISYYSVSLHPWTLTLEKLSHTNDFITQNHLDKNFIALGECGLDKVCDTPFDLQQEAFCRMIELSEEYKKPLIIHCVKAFDELIFLKNRYQPKQTWIIHGFRGNPTQAQQLIRQGFCLSFGPKHNTETIKTVPLGAIFAETDDSGCSIEEVYRLISSELNISIELLSEKIRNNALKYINLHI